MSTYSLPRRLPTRQIWVNTETGEQFDTEYMTKGSVNPVTNRVDKHLFNVGIPRQLDKLIDNKMYRRKYRAMIKRGELRYLLAYAEVSYKKPGQPSHYFATGTANRNWENTKNVILRNGSYKKFELLEGSIITEDPPSGKSGSQDVSREGSRDPHPYKQQCFIRSSDPSSAAPGPGIQAEAPSSEAPGIDYTPDYVPVFWDKTDFPSGIRYINDPDSCAKITILRDDYDDCILWQAEIDDDGYGVFKVEGKKHQAHRWIFEQAHGVLLPPEIEVDHTCCTRHCVNLRHLKDVTKLVNLSRRRRRGSVRPPNPGPVKEDHKRRPVSRPPGTVAYINGKPVTQAQYDAILDAAHQQEIAGFGLGQEDDMMIWNRRMQWQQT